MQSPLLASDRFGNPVGANPCSMVVKTQQKPMKPSSAHPLHSVPFESSSMSSFEYHTWAGPRRAHSALALFFQSSRPQYRDNSTIASPQARSLISWSSEFINHRILSTFQNVFFPGKCYFSPLSNWQSITVLSKGLSSCISNPSFYQFSMLFSGLVEVKLEFTFK